VSIPAACGGWDETRAAYRLFDHDTVAAERVLAPHIACTETRLTYIADREGDIFDLFVGLDHNSDHHVTSATGRRASALASTLERGSQIPARGRTYDQRLFVEAPCPDQGADWLVRVQHGDRLLSDGRTLRAAFVADPATTEIRFDHPAGKGRSARTVDQQLKVVRVTLKAPVRPDRTLVDVTVTALLATEPNPPAGEDPLEWVLLTNLPVETPEEASEKLLWYLCRWQV